KVTRELAPAAEGVITLAQQRQQAVVWRYPERKRDCAIAVVGHYPVHARPERARAAYLRRFVAPHGRHEWRLALSVDRPHALVQRPRERHEPVEVARLVGAQTDVLRAP